MSHGATGYALLCGIGLAAIASIGADRYPGKSSHAQLTTNGQLAELEGHPGAFCWAPDAPPNELVRYAAAAYSVGQRSFTSGRWPGPPATPVALTYSFPPDGTPVDLGATNSLHALLDGQFAGLGGEAEWKSLFRRAFDSWEAVTGNRFTEVVDDGAPWPDSPGVAGVRGDIRIAARRVDGAGGVIAFTYYPGNGGDMILDTSEAWSGSFADFRFVRNAIGHELGHALGLAHSCPNSGQFNGQTKLMEPNITTAFDGPQPDDIRGAQSLYGDPLEPNNTTVTAIDLDAHDPPLMPGVPLAITGVSLHDSQDVDLFALTAPPNSTISLVAAPQGIQYLAGPQNANGSCPAGIIVDPRRQQNLAIDVLNQSGAAVFSRNAAPLGEPETLANFNLGFGGRFYIRVRSGGSSGDVQPYTVTFTLANNGVAGDLNGDGCVNSTDLGILLGSWGAAPSPADITGDGVVNSVDLAALLGAWGQGCGGG